MIADLKLNETTPLLDDALVLFPISEHSINRLPRPVTSQTIMLEKVLFWTKTSTVWFRLQ